MAILENPPHQSYATAIDSLAGLRAAQGRYEEADKLYAQCLKLHETRPSSNLMELAETFSRVMKRPIAFVEQPLDQVIQSNPENALMMEWFNTQGYQAVLPALRALYPSLLTMETWIRETGWQA